MEEQWTAIEDFPNYAVSDKGHVTNLVTGKRLKQTPINGGYMRVNLSHDGKYKQVYVHKLVAQAFLPDYRHGVRIAHRNGKLSDNKASNLRLMLGLDKSKQRVETREVWGERVRVRETGMVFISVRTCARYIGGDYSTIYACLRGQRRQHLGYTFEYIVEEDNEED